MDDHQFEEIAIIGMACRFPKSKNPEEFWHVLQAGMDAISFFSDAELLDEGVEKNTLHHSHYVKAKGIVESPELFDAALFGYSAKEAETMDPQHRLLLQCGWEALENAGYDPFQYDKLIGVFVGGNPSSYYLTHLFPTQDQQDELAFLLGNGHDYLATKLSYKLNLKGPSKTIQTACSTSLVAVHDACQALLNFQCDLALAGGVSVTFPHKTGYFYSQEGIYSPDGKCRAFDQKAAGTVFSEGVGLVVLKRLEDALKDDDHILAIIKGSAVNNDGADKMSFLAPSVEGQAKVIASALASANISADEITYIEAHGTGTSLGDPIEIAALTKAFALHTSKKQFCAVGSVKTNLGHLISAAGIASLLKTILMMQHRKIPPCVNFTAPNPKIPFSNTPFYVNACLQDWTPQGVPLRAGISSFGMGGTNAHVILEEPPRKKSLISQDVSYYLLPFSAHSSKALRSLLQKHIEDYRKNKPAIADVAYTLQLGRKALSFRTYVVASDIDQAIVQMENGRVNQTQFHPFQEFLHTMGTIWEKGDSISWEKCNPQKKGKRIPLPTYPFDDTAFIIHLIPEKKAQESLGQSTSVKIVSGTPVQKIVSIIWQETLKVAGLSLEDDFFRLGGDSFSALQILDQLRILFCIHVSLQDFFSHSNLEGLSRIVEERIEMRTSGAAAVKGEN